MLLTWAASSGLNPTLSLDFLTPVLDGRITASGGANGTRVNSSGLIVAATTPRFDYDPVTLACKGLLVEEARTNLLTRSQDFADASWSASAATITASAAISPDGATNGALLKEGSTTARHFIGRSATVAVSSGGDYTFSVFAKAAGRTKIVMLVAGSDLKDRTFDLSNGTSAVGQVVVTNPTSWSIVSAGNGWYRCSITFTAAAASTDPRIYLSNGSSADYLGDNTSGAYLFGAQLEAGSFPTSYIPTAGSTVTRSADTCALPTTGWYNAAQGTLFMDATFIGTLDSSSRSVRISDGTTANIHQVGRFSNLAIGSTDVSSVTQASLSGSVNVVAGTPLRMAYAYASNDFAYCSGAGTVSTDASGSLPTVSEMGWGGTLYTSPLNAYLRSLRYYPRRLSNQQLQVLT